MTVAQLIEHIGAALAEGRVTADTPVRMVDNADVFIEWDEDNDVLWITDVDPEQW